jgi:hypothetical protein
MTFIRRIALAAVLMLPPTLAVVATPASATASCATIVSDGSFERQVSSTVGAPWLAENHAGIDIGRGYSYAGANNAWARNTTGWNAVRQPVSLTGGAFYQLTIAVRTSPNVSAGYLGFRDGAQRPVAEARFGPLSTYQQLYVGFRPSQTGTFNVFAGFWAPNQDSWIQIDAVSIAGPCDDTP